MSLPLSSRHASFIPSADSRGTSSSRRFVQLPDLLWGQDLEHPQFLELNDGTGRPAGYLSKVQFAYYKIADLRILYQKLSSLRKPSVAFIVAFNQYLGPWV
ncbi:hypothetical protein RI367_007763, partial [Sorochytrium milnesiophthora]